MKDEFIDYLRKLNQKDRLQELNQFFLDLMDWYEQSEEETVYIKLHEVILNQSDHQQNPDRQDP